MYIYKLGDILMLYFYIFIFIDFLYDIILNNKWSINKVIINFRANFSNKFQFAHVSCLPKPHATCHIIIYDCNKIICGIRYMIINRLIVRSARSGEEHIIIFELNRGKYWHWLHRIHGTSASNEWTKWMNKRTKGKKRSDSNLSRPWNNEYICRCWVHGNEVIA